MSDTEGADNANGELSIKEEYELWRKNCRYMYEFVSETALKWPSLTVQWLPDYTTEGDSGAYNCKLLLGTNTSGQETDYLKLALTTIPSGGVAGGANVNTRIKVIRKYENPLEINRARYMPQDPNTVATINGDGQVDIYDLNEEAGPLKTAFKFHTENGYGLSWNPHQKGYLLSASDDKTVVLTDIDSQKKVFQNSFHLDIVNDVQWHTQHTFGTASDDKYVCLFDIRVSSENPVSKLLNEDSKGVNTLLFSPFAKNLMALGNANSNISLVDLRHLDRHVHTMMGHSDLITCLEFLLHKDGVLALGSQDRRVMIWDLFKIGEEQQQEDAEDGCPELFMMHAGHTGPVMDLSWCPFNEWTLASVAEDNIVHLWQVGQTLLNSDTSVVVSNDVLE